MKGLIERLETAGTERELVEKRGRIFMAPRTDDDYKEIFEYVDEVLGDAMVAFDKGRTKLASAIGEFETLLGGIAGKPEKEGKKAMKGFETGEKALVKAINTIYDARSAMYAAEREFKK